MQTFEEEQKTNWETGLMSIMYGVDNKGNDLSETQQRTIIDFDNFNEDKGCRLATRKNYAFHIKSMGIFTQKDFNKISIEDRRKFFREYFKDKSDSYKESYKMTIIKFFEWLNKKPFYDVMRKELDKLDSNDKNYYKKTKKIQDKYLPKINSIKKDNILIIADIKVSRKHNDKLPEELLNLDDINKLTAVADNFRDKCIIKLLYETGSRKSEFLKLKIKHCEQDANGYVVMLPMGKTKSRRLRIINAVPDIVAWLNSHPDKKNTDAALFVGLARKPGKSLSGDGLKVVVKKLAKRSKIKKNVFPHLFRHSRATELARLGFNEAQLRVFFGWSKSSTTPSKYIHLAGSDIDNAILELNGNIDAIQKAQKEAQKLKSWDCPRCKISQSSSEHNLCTNCGWDRNLDYKTYQFQEVETDDLKDQMAQILARMTQLEEVNKAIAIKKNQNRKNV